MDISFEYQDFIAPVNEIKGIKSMKIYAVTKDDTSTNISEISEFTTNENKDITVQPSELLVFDTTNRLIIDIEG